MDTSNDSIIGKFIFKKVQNIYSRYKSISEEEINTIRKFIENIEENSLGFDIYLNYNATKAIAEVTEFESSKSWKITFSKIYLLKLYSNNLTCNSYGESYHK